MPRADRLTDERSIEMNPDMFDRELMQITTAIVGIDLCFSGIDQRAYHAISACMKNQMRFADLEHAEWFWANYGNTTHIVARHHVTYVPEHLLGSLEDMVYDCGVDIAGVISAICGMKAACEGMEFHFPDCPIVHAPNMLHRM